MVSEKRIMFVFGTRPEAIKMAPVIEEVKKYEDFFDPLVVVTAQHREMLDQVLNIFNLKPDYDLGVMEKGQSLSHIVIKSLRGLEEIIVHESPEMILVQGDTTTTFVAALAAYFHRIPVGHIEAGLRTMDKFNPYPEEINRKLTTVLADLNFAPTELSVQNLLREGVKRSSIYLTGNTVIDALFEVARRPFDLAGLGLDLKKEKKIILVTAHRRESFGAPMRRICSAIKEIAIRHAEVATIILPVHKNPLVRDTVNEILGDLGHVYLTEPMDYEPFVHLMKASDIILTDSGGIQEEAPSLGKPVLVMREVTERPEAVEAKSVKVVGTDEQKIIEETERLLTDQREYDKMAKAINPYGDGHAAKRITGALLHHFGFIDKRPEEFDVQKTGGEKLL